MYFVIVDGKQVNKHSLLWEEALIEAAQTDYIYNSPELNDGIKGEHKVEIMSAHHLLR